MCLYRHCDRGIGYAECDFCKGVSCAGCDYNYIEQIFRTYRLGGGDVVYYLFSAQLLNLFDKLLGFSEAGIGGIYYLGHYGFYGIALDKKTFKGGYGLLYSAKRAAKGIS